MKHLLVIRLSALGDAAILAPVLRRLTDTGHTLPQITVAAPPRLEALFNDIPGVRFLGVEKRQSAMRLFRTFRAVEADAVADMHHVGRVDRALALLRLDALLHFRPLAIRHIRKGRLSRCLFLHHIDTRPRRSQADRYADVLRRLGIPFPEGCLQQPVRIAERQQNPATLGFAPFAQHKGKIWPQEYSEQLIRMLSESGYRVLLFGSRDEAPLLDSWATQHSGVTSLAGRHTFAEELDIIRSLTLMVSMDSANMHFASAVGTPVVSIWGATHPDFGFYGYGQDRANALCANLPCQPCSAFGQRPCRHGDYRCLRAIKPETVFQKIIQWPVTSDH